MNKPLMLLVLVITVGVITGCATLFNPKKADVSFSSDPEGATVFVDGFNMGKTPVVLLIEKKKTHTIEFKKDGYETRAYVLNNHVGVGYIILDIVAGLIPVVVDAVTGDWYQLDETDVRIILGDGTPEGQKGAVKKATKK